jgi:hypothetical protein
MYITMSRVYYPTRIPKNEQRKRLFKSSFLGPAVKAWYTITPRFLLYAFDLAGKKYKFAHEMRRLRILIFGLVMYICSLKVMIVKPSYRKGLP